MVFQVEFDSRSPVRDEPIDKIIFYYSFDLQYFNSKQTDSEHDIIHEERSVLW